ncbi:peptidylprolyl isomerase [Sphingomonas sp. BN140010]|uniref:Parvulin-like PPIase n=1 Tax=Sphingomonas arvum TaxID=2992113 RepID=A0ABT3JHX9_9SPHN|nr:peptidylprolyl isomerase [Sphingomonas sp. BN140010]MCW3798677.1 peptidylprolyl isomerase [Sphingomonas sp. BN140010]
MAARIKFLATAAMIAGASMAAVAAQPRSRAAAPRPAQTAQRTQTTQPAQTAQRVQTTQPAQTIQRPSPSAAAGPNTTAGLRIPTNVTVFGSAMPSVVKASAIVNGEVITQTDIDQRLALLAISQGGQIPQDEVERLRVQVLRNLIDETLQMQAAKAAEIEVKQSDVDRTIARVAQNIKQTPEQMATYLKANGSSIRSMRRQVEGEIAWQRLQRQKIESQVNVGDDEVKAVIDRLNASKGAAEYRVGEIYLEANPTNEAEVLANARKIVAAIQQGGSFVGYARQYSVATTASVGGDLGWVRPEQLPDQLSAVLRQMQPGSLSQPIRVPGGFSIIAVQDTRKVLTADPRDAELSLKQVSISFPKGTARTAAEPTVQRFAAAARSVGGCGGAEKLAADFRGDVVTSDAVKLRDLPPVLQQMMLPMQVGQATQPFGNIDEGVRVLVICGRDEPTDASAPNREQVAAQLTEERVNLRARRFLRDLRRDAVIDFR